MSNGMDAISCRLRIRSERLIDPSLHLASRTVTPLGRWDFGEERAGSRRESKWLEESRKDAEEYGETGR
jgi:hypothetical protein